MYASSKNIQPIPLGDPQQEKKFSNTSNKTDDPSPAKAPISSSYFKNQHRHVYYLCYITSCGGRILVGDFKKPYTRIVELVYTYMAAVRLDVQIQR